MYLTPLLLVVAAVPGGQPFSVPSLSPWAVSALPGDEAALKTAFLTPTGPSLLEFFRKRSQVVPDPVRLAALLKQLGDAEPARHNEAAAELVGYGQSAVPLLRQAINNADDREVVSRARQCLGGIEGQAAAALTLSAIRVLAVQRPPGTAEVLLTFLPFAEDEQVVGQVQSALASVGLVEGKPDQALVRALEDSVPVRRAVAASVLARIGGRGQQPMIRPLLKDPRPSVRLKVALALVENDDAEAVPILIDLLSDLPDPQRKAAEDYLVHLAGEWALTTPTAADKLSQKLRRDLWHTWWRNTDGPTLLREFQSRTLPDADRFQVLALIAKLDDESPEEREKAAEALLTRGPNIVPLLRRAQTQANPRQAAFLAKCLQAMEKDVPPPLPRAAPRLLALRRPEGTLTTLLAYLPFAEDAELASQVRDLIAVVGYNDNKPEPALVQALQDPVNVRRAVAAEVLCRSGSPELPAVRKLLQDSDPQVRASAALALAGLGEREAIPVLISLLGDLPSDRAWDVDEYLHRLAGETGPVAGLPLEAEGRKKYRDQWSAWWRDHGARVELARGDVPRHLGLTLVIESYNASRRSGSITELDRAGKQLWQISNVIYPQDAEILPGHRVLIAEQQRVTERDQTGKVLWERAFVNPIAVNRLRNGNTFIGGRNLLVEVDVKGKEVFNHPVTNDTILTCHRFRDGQIAYLTYQGHYVRLDSSGKEVKSFRLPLNPGLGINGAEVLPGDRVLVSVQNPSSKVTEYDATGKVLWEGVVQWPGAPSRLPGGHTLVVSYSGMRITEFDRGGKIVSELKDLPVRPWRVSRR